MQNESTIRASLDPRENIKVFMEVHKNDITAVIFIIQTFILAKGEGDQSAIINNIIKSYFRNCINRKEYNRDFPEYFITAVTIGINDNLKDNIAKGQFDTIITAHARIMRQSLTKSVNELFEIMDDVERNGKTPYSIVKKDIEDLKESRPYKIGLGGENARIYLEKAKESEEFIPVVVSRGHKG